MFNYTVNLPVVCVCVRVCICVRVCECAYVLCFCACVFMYVCVHVHSFVRICVYVCVRVHVRTYMCVRVHVYMNTCMCMRTHCVYAVIPIHTQVIHCHVWTCRWYMDVLGKACKDKEESCGDGKLNFAEINDILTIANQVAEHSRQGINMFVYNFSHRKLYI